MAPTGPSGWRDCLAEGRLPLFALVTLGVFLTAADSLIVATMLPDIGAALGGYAYLGWTVAGFMLGLVVASASAGAVSQRLGLRRAAAMGSIVFAAGSAASASAPDMAVFLLGRLIQGIGGGWISGFAMVIVGLGFPERHIARVFAATAAVWAIATATGPLIGGVFAPGGGWRIVFWGFAACALGLSVASLLLLPGGRDAKQGEAGLPWPQLALLGCSIGLMAVAGLAESPVVATILTTSGFLLLVWLVRFDGRREARLLPRSATDPRTVAGAGHVALFALTAASVGLNAYAPAILQQLHGLTALGAGYAVASMAMAWTIAAFAVAGAGPESERRWILFGAAAIFAATAALSIVMPIAPLGLIVAVACVMGLGFGCSSSLMNRRMLARVDGSDKAVGSSALIAARQTGGAAGAAIAATAANFAGFDRGLTDESARSAGFWVFAALVPLAAVRLAAAWQMTLRGPERHERVDA